MPWPKKNPFTGVTQAINPQSTLPNLQTPMPAPPVPMANPKMAPAVKPIVGPQLDNEIKKRALFNIAAGKKGF